MQWKARITGKSSVALDGSMTYSFTIVGGGEDLQTDVQVTGNPTIIQDLISAKVTQYAEAYELGAELPNEGEELTIIQNGGE